MLASYSEGLPYALLEAMAAGVVPIVTPVGAIPDVVGDGEHGLLVAPADAVAVAAALERLSVNRKDLERMSAACRARIAAAYSIDRVARDFTQLYWGVCATRGHTDMRGLATAGPGFRLRARRLASSVARWAGCS